MVGCAAAPDAPAVFKDAFDFALVCPPPGGPGEGPDCHFPKEIGGFGPIPGQIRGETHLLLSFWPSAQLGCVKDLSLTGSFEKPTNIDFRLSDFKISE